MKKTNKYIVILIIIIVIGSTIVFLKCYKRNEIIQSPSNNVLKDKVAILDSTKNLNAPYTYKKVYKHEDGKICIDNCDKNKKKKLYAIIKTENPFPKILSGSDESKGLLIEDGNYIKLVDLENKIMRSLDKDGSDYQLIINEENIIGFINNTRQKSYFYNYNLEKTYYLNQYDKFDFIDKQLVAYTEDSIHILNQETEKILIEVKNINTSENKIKSIESIEEKIYINCINKDGYTSSYIYDNNNEEISRIEGKYEKITIDKNKIYAINDQEVKIYETNGTLTKTVALDKINIKEVIQNYIIAVDAEELKIINMDNGNKIELLKNIDNNIVITKVEKNEKTKEIKILLSEHNNETILKKYEITYNVETKIVETKNIN